MVFLIFGKLIRWGINSNPYYPITIPLKFFPNPFDSYLIFSGKYEIEQVTILSSDGHVVFSTNGKQYSIAGRGTTSVSNLPKGIYIAIIRDTKSVKTFKTD